MAVSRWQAAKETDVEGPLYIRIIIDSSTLAPSVMCLLQLRAREYCIPLSVSPL